MVDTGPGIIVTIMVTTDGMLHFIIITINSADSYNCW